MVACLSYSSVHYRFSLGSGSSIRYPPMTSKFAMGQISIEVFSWIAFEVQALRVRCYMPEFVRLAI